MRAFLDLAELLAHAARRPSPLLPYLMTGARAPLAGAVLLLRPVLKCFVAGSHSDSVARFIWAIGRDSGAAVGHAALVTTCASATYVVLTL